MQKAVLISISPKWCDLIKSGKKTVEARKTVPKSLLPYKCYIYETKNSGGSGKVIGEFICDKHIWVLSHPCIFAKRDTFHSKAIDDACLTMGEVEKYSAGKDVYGMTISNLVIYDEPIDVYAFYSATTGKQLTRPPQSWCYVKELED